MISLNEKESEALGRILEYETGTPGADWPLGWSWRDVRVYPAVLNKLYLRGYLDTMFKSNSYTGYRLTDLGKAAAAAQAEGHSGTLEDEPLSLPDDIFADIIGHEEVKDLLRAALLAERPVHVLLAGPPALAKTLFLWDIERVAGEKAVWLVGSATSKAGLWDLVAERQPEVLLIDELDKMGAGDIAALLSIMEGGRLVRAKVGRKLDTTVPVRVVAAANSLARLSPELVSRFAVRHISSYSRADFLAVVRGVLVRREGLVDALAEEIARALDGRSQDVRDAVRAARLAPQLGVEKAIKLLLGA
jgi:Holliday junction DNA helicase RuvB